MCVRGLLTGGLLPENWMNSSIERSLFVSVLAWIMIVTGGFGCLVSLMQNLMFFFLFPRDELQQALSDDATMQHMPAAARLMFQNMHLLVLGMLAVMVSIVVCGVGLLKRRLWAQRGVSALLGLGVIWIVGAFVLQQWMLSEFPMPGPEFSQQGPDVEVFMLTIRVFSGLMALGLAALHGWLLWRLNTPAIRAEFG
jgi:hypothetical protein